MFLIECFARVVCVNSYQECKGVLGYIIPWGRVELAAAFLCQESTLPIVV